MASAVPGHRSKAPAKAPGAQRETGGASDGSSGALDWFSDPSHREAALAVIHEVLAAVEPLEVEVTLGFIEPLLDCAVRGEPIVFDSSEEAGRFGGGDWLVLAAVPLVVALVEERVAELVRDGSPETAAPWGAAAPAIGREAVHRVLSKVDSPHAWRRRDELVAALAAGAARHLARNFTVKV
jgi:hypothetical protein